MQGGEALTIARPPSYQARSPDPALKSPQSPSAGSSVTPRAPVVHFFVCDHGNAKVKAVTDQFIEMMSENGIKVYTERYTTHQPGYQVRAASLNSPADFFFQIHSKTAGAGHVRLYVGGKPKRMSLAEAVSHVWAWWKLASGAISRDEADVLSSEKLAFLIREFAGFEGSIDELGARLRDGDVNVIEELQDAEVGLVEGRQRVTKTPPIACEWVRERGGQIQRCPQLPHVRGLSAPLKELLIAVIDESLVKVRRMMDIAATIAPMMVEADEEEEADEIEIEVEHTRGDATGWRMMIESLDDDRMGSVKIASYGDSAHLSMDVVNPLFKLDEY